METAAAINNTQENQGLVKFPATPEQQLQILNKIYRALNNLKISGEQAEVLAEMKHGIMFVTRSLLEEVKIKQAGQK